MKNVGQTSTLAITNLLQVCQVITLNHMLVQSKGYKIPESGLFESWAPSRSGYQAIFPEP